MGAQLSAYLHGTVLLHLRFVLAEMTRQKPLRGSDLRRKASWLNKFLFYAGTAAISLHPVNPSPPLTAGEPDHHALIR